MDPQRQYPKISLLRRLKLLEEGSHILQDTEDNIQFELFLQALEMAGILRFGEEKNSQNPLRRIIPDSAVESSAPVIAMDSTFSFVLYPGISLDYALKLASFSSIKEDTPFCFELSRSAVVQSYDRGLSSSGIINLLKELSGNRIEEGLEWTLRDWESRYAAVSLCEGLVLSLTEERRYLAETKPMASLIRKTLAPGLYLLSGNSTEAVEALQKAGVDIIARPKSESKKPAHSGWTGNWTFPPLGNGKDDFGPKIDVKNETANLGNTSSSSPELMKDHFRQHLMGQSISKAEKDELLSRINRRVIFTETQLEKAAIKFEKLEARLLDYPGKTALVKQAMVEGSQVEVSVPSLENGTTITYGIPQALEKKEGDSVLVLKLFSEDTEVQQIIRIPLGKISLLRRIKPSIFGE
jgi:hypothetical protein